MEILNSILSWGMKKRIHQIEFFIKNPHEIQNELLTNLIKKANKTVYGKNFGFSSIENYEHFKQQVPVVTYEKLFPYIERLLKGEKQILWPSDISWFAKSSGTTNNARSKFIPVSQEALKSCHYKAGKDLLSIYLNNYSNSKIFSGKGLTIGGSYHVNEFNSYSNSFYGDVSAVLIKNLPWWVQMLQTPNLEIALMDEWEEKLDKMIEATSSENVTSISGVPTWVIVFIEKMIKKNKVNNLLEIWPNLEVFFHGAVSFTPYEDIFKKLIPLSMMNYMETYNASEGFFGIQDQLHSKEMLLMLDYGVFYEFIPFSELDQEHPKIIPLNQVEIGKNYAIVITTNAGLWRYKIGDTVTFTCINPYRIKISGRTTHFINAFGEEVIIDNAEIAITKAAKKTNATIGDFTAGPAYFGKENKGRHEWIIEFIQMPDDIHQFTTLLDKTLREVNSDYDAKRYKNLVLQTPLVHIAPKKTFYKWMKSKGKLGGQHKVPRLSNNREFLDELLKYVET